MLLTPSLLAPAAVQGRQLKQVPSDEPLLSTRPEEFLDQTFGTDPQEQQAEVRDERLTNVTRLPFDEPEKPEGFVPQELPFDDNLNEILLQPDGTEDPLRESLPIDEPETPFVEAALGDNVPEAIEAAPDPDPTTRGVSASEIPADQVPELVDFVIREPERVQGAEGNTPAQDAAPGTPSQDESDPIPDQIEEAPRDPVAPMVEESSPGNNDPVAQRVLGVRQDVPVEPLAFAPVDPLIEEAVEDPSSSAEAEIGADGEHAAVLDQSESAPEFQAAPMDPITPMMEESPVATFLENALVEPRAAAPRDPLVEILVEDPSAQVGPEEALASQEPQSAAPIEEGPLDPFTPAMELSPLQTVREKIPVEPLAAVPADPLFEAALEDPATPMEEGIAGIAAGMTPFLRDRFGAQR